MTYELVSVYDYTNFFNNFSFFSVSLTDHDYASTGIFLDKELPTYHSSHLGF